MVMVAVDDDVDHHHCAAIVAVVDIVDLSMLN